MDERKTLKNVAKAIKMMTAEERARLEAYSEGLAFMARKRQAEKADGQ